MTRLRALLWTSGAPFRAALIGSIKTYRVTLGGLLGGQCRFHPSCSHYAEEAIRYRGAVVGIGLAAWRLLRCNPYGRPGLDPVPRSASYDLFIRSGGNGEVQKGARP
jgi:uncharacterized protein